jgi:hypothetical protein
VRKGCREVFSRSSIFFERSQSIRSPPRSLTGISTTSRFIERYIWFDFGFVRADALVWMTMRVHEVARTVRLQRNDLEHLYRCKNKNLEIHTIGPYIADSLSLLAMRPKTAFLLTGIRGSSPLLKGRNVFKAKLVTQIYASSSCLFCNALTCKAWRRRLSCSMEFH